MKRGMRSVLLLLLLVLPGCASTVMTAALYDQTCSAATDCVAVVEGDKCGFNCGCANAAINAKAASFYAADKNAIACVDLPFRATPAIACRECIPVGVAGLEGKCAIAR